MNIHCKGCGETILYKDYCDQLRAIVFKGITCPHCGHVIKPHYSVVVGTGAKTHTTYATPIKSRLQRHATHRSCHVCHTFWNGDEHKNCPFCGETVVDQDHVVQRIVPGTSSKNPYLSMLLRIEDLKLDVLHHELQEARSCENSFKDCFIEDGAVNLTSWHKAYASSQRASSFHRGCIKNVVSNISKLQSIFRKRG